MASPHTCARQKLFDNVLAESNYNLRKGRIMGDFNKIENIRKDRKKAHTKLSVLKSKVYEKFLELEKLAFSDGTLKKKDKELIAIGISIVVNCESCIEWHITQAQKSGATVDEILEAIEVGIEFGGGPATVATRFALNVIDAVF